MDKLVHVRIDCSGNLRDARFDLVGDVVPFGVAAGYLNVDRRRNAEIQDLADDIWRGEIKFHVRKIVMQFLSQDFHVLRSRLVVGIESDQNFAIGRADRRIVTKGEINPACRQPDVIEHVLDFVRRNDFANYATHLKKSFLGRFEPSACGGSHMQTKLAGIDRWEKVAAEKRNETT